MGSGTTLFECEKLNRKYIGFDINPERRYVMLLDIHCILLGSNNLSSLK